MTIVHSGQTHMVTVAQGKQGRENFQKAVRKIFNLSDNEVIQLTFGCKVPGSGEFLLLKVDLWFKKIVKFKL